MKMKSLVVSSFAIFVIVVGLSSCGERAEPELPTAKLTDYIELRRYAMRSDSKIPRPQWAFDSKQVLAATATGMSVFREGADIAFTNEDGKTFGSGCWIDSGTIALASQTAIREAEQGRLQVPNDGLTVVTFADKKFGEPMAFDKYAFAPQATGQWVYFSSGENIRRLHVQEKESEPYDVGFYVNPSRYGVTLQTRPVEYDDIWTGSNEKNELLVRWEDGTTKLFPAVIRAKWSADGNVYALQMRDAGLHSKHLGSASMDLVRIEKELSGTIEIAKDARHVSPHPYFKNIISYESKNGEIFVLDVYESTTRSVAQKAREPQWSPDGRNLLILKDHPNGTEMEVIRFRIRNSEEKKD